MTSTVSINISTPSFYSPQKKFAPVVAPKPKVNPFKAAGPIPENASEQRLPPAAGACAQIGKVGEIPIAVTLPPAEGKSSLLSSGKSKGCSVKEQDGKVAVVGVFWWWWVGGEEEMAHNHIKVVASRLEGVDLYLKKSGIISVRVWLPELC